VKYGIEFSSLFKSSFLQSKLPVVPYASFLSLEVQTLRLLLWKIMYTSHPEHPVINHNLFKENVMMGKVTDD